MPEANRPILLIGNTGQVGWELQRTLMPLGEVIAVGRGSSPLSVDLADPDSIRALLRQVQPALIVNAAAYTAVDKAEEEADLAMAVNGTAPGILAEEAKSLRAGLLHFSTDYVFDGRAATPYPEAQQPNPANIYGQTKLAGEQSIQAVGGAFLILRTSWVYGTRGSNFLLTVLRLAAEREELRIVDDQIGSPTWSRLIAESTAQILAKAPLHINEINPFPSYLEANSGIYHLSSAGQTSWFGFARSIVERVKSSKELKVRQLTPISTKDYKLPAQRPMFSVLSTDKLESTFGQHLPHWETALTLCAQEWLEN